MDKLLHEIGGAMLAFIVQLLPAALGAIVSLVYEPDVTWSRRFAQTLVGVIVSYFVTNAVGAMWPWPPLVEPARQAIGFVLGMIAFRATPKFIAAAGDRLADLPAALADRFLPRRKDAE